MIAPPNISAYCRISVDDELDRDNTSIENQKAIIEDYVRRTFPDSELTFYDDRDRSGYTFEQREGYQRMRRELIERGGILIIKDFSRFSRRNGRGLVELEDLRDAGVRIISIGDGIDYPTNDDWLQIQLHFFINEMPVTDTSKKVKNVIQRRQSDGKWICAVPYGYVITNTKNMTFEVEESAAEIVRRIFELYNGGWGYKKIANYLTGLSIPTPRSLERERAEAGGAEYKARSRPEWSIATIQGILGNDFYIGTLRQHKFSRKKINGADVKTNPDEQIVFENHHEPIIDYRTFAVASEQRERRGVTHYRGVKKNDNAYSGFLYCGDCGAPMFSMSRRDLQPAYTCGTYHRRGLKGCTSHHTRVDLLDSLMKTYIVKVRENSAAMMERLEQSIRNEHTEIKRSGEAAVRLSDMLAAAREELKAAKRQKLREIVRRPEHELLIEETYAELESELEAKVRGLQNQLAMTADRRNEVIRVNRAASTALDIFDGIIRKDKLDRRDLELIIDRVTVYTERIEIKLKSDIDALLRLDAAENVADGRMLSVESGTVKEAVDRKGRIINVINGGDPLEIYTEKDGEVIFKKYSPMGEWSESAGQLCETMYKTAGCCAAVSDRDAYISVCGVPKRELSDKHISNELEQLMEGRRQYQRKNGERGIPMTDATDKYVIETAAPIISEGDVLGCVVFFSEGDKQVGEVEYKLAQTIAAFLGKQMES